MTGPDHYRAAEALFTQLDELGEKVEESGGIMPVEQAKSLDRAVALMLARAQVHATLAQAAATALNGYSRDGMYVTDYRDWDTACSVDPIERGQRR